MQARIPALSGALLLCLAASAAAQNSAAISSTVTITPSLTIAGVRDLNFGSIPQGLTNVSINDPAFDPRAGQLRVTAQPQLPVLLTFQLPVEMSDGAGHTIPLSDWTGAFLATGPGLASFTPTTTSVQGAFIGTDGILDVFLGARLGLTTNQFIATYNAVVIVNAFYN